MLLRGDDTNPVLHIEELRRFPRRRPASVPGAAHVYLNSNDRFYCPPGGFTAGELWLLGPRRLYVVDVSPHDLVRSLDVVSPASGVSASLAVSFVWRVYDPPFIVASNLVDVMVVIPEMLRAAVTEEIATLSWQTPPQLAALLTRKVLPARIALDGIELTGLSAEVLTLDDEPPAPRDSDG